ncbi:N-formylglutamate amidohydrolase [Blastopirellula sp. JC732]|uniref:N-formylglutamate amidohydrolase n=1 Tax=Blastopirellula sediminis TaxID=2894196 RepID=A0A9X1MIH3_9BACT|nr:N-formylglutamate amidohydrolase [Blastopirellula sediminis]MCC9604377.1 N-formylglutamate amidohydrolase [Blastopirellula sediminis]MCC9626897.1 N-formylglutamate amidohydrolase [Blastopirellula sediminis]
MDAIVLSCEHGGNEVPSEYRDCFRDAEQVLASHRGWDPGTLEMGQAFQRSTGAPLITSTVTRLLVELNRSLGHARLFSQYTRDLPSGKKREILDRYYLPHRTHVQEAIDEYRAVGKRVIHLGLHTFTPELNGEVRTAEIGLLYDPSRPGEKSFCAAWRARLIALRPDLRVRLNYPYLGKADGLTTYLRKRYPDDQYVGVELEVNQRLVAESDAWKTLITDLAQTFLTGVRSPVS